VSAYERNEVILHYVVALEALLADEGNLDLSRKVSYRAATLFGTDDERERVARLVKTAYEVRSKYAHGDDLGRDVDLDELRQVARQVVLRWLVLATNRSDGKVSPEMGSIPRELDRASLSDAVRRELVLKPLRAFFQEHPPADPERRLIDRIPRPVGDLGSHPLRPQTIDHPSANGRRIISPAWLFLCSCRCDASQSHANRRHFPWWSRSI
jgi:hypothetical protein